ncbi:Endoplasmic reticulum-Golgi intermediate compartment protein 2 [Strongyloides ratti]|uniref:Endoplasmic reticulum-Golgi intermediate compartment protein 2 n=1 Tax=Strongyloides ratti TaxID=34506 RepID=A0A090LT20_STRRB|nr:Endoplasmic reticulum-Golgi intermediate compartment protein 2 [Strongyloides ratti]CEF70729.1 Endoplasmic reticulum-Golgi intermediate compartment protein 2 [Strongyloides ratti]
MSLPEQGLRQRRTILEVIQELDSFNKVQEKVKEEKNAAKGFASFIVITIIIIITLGHTYDRFYGQKEYTYSMNTADYTESFPKLTIDMQLATSCGNFELKLPQSDVVSQIFDIFDEKNDNEPTLNKDPTRFELSEKEYKYWRILQDAHRKKYNKGNIEKQLKEAADIKQEEEKKELSKGHQDNDNDVDPFFGGNNKVIIFGNGIGMLQIISSNTKNSMDEGTACRIHGELEIKKMQSETISIITGGGSNELENMIAHLQGTVKSGNSSHRIESFYFGDKNVGVVTPLAGVEEISLSGKTVYTYNIKVIPTRIYYGSIFSSPSLVYQYAVTSIKSEPSSIEEHGHGGIVIVYELTGTVIEIKESTMTTIQFFLRLCSLIGGIYATVTFLSIYISKLFEMAGTQ